MICIFALRALCLTDRFPYNRLPLPSFILQVTGHTRRVTASGSSTHFESRPPVDGLHSKLGSGCRRSCYFVSARVKYPCRYEKRSPSRSSSSSHHAPRLPPDDLDFRTRDDPSFTEPHLHLVEVYRFCARSPVRSQVSALGAGAVGRNKAETCVRRIVAGCD